MIDLRNTWCEATINIHNKLNILGFDHEPINYNINYYSINNNYEINSLYEFGSISKNYKQIELVDGEFQYVKEETREDSFNKHGFETPKFEGEILKEISDNLWIGYALIDDIYIPFTVNSKGFISGGQFSNDFKLTPIKKPWYENADNFPCMVMYNERELVQIRSYENNNINILGKVLCSSIGGIYYAVFNCRPATEDEVLSLLVRE